MFVIQMTFYVSIMLFAVAVRLGAVSSRVIGNKKNCRNPFEMNDFRTAVRFRPAPPKVLTPIAGD